MNKENEEPVEGAALLWISAADSRSLKSQKQDQDDSQSFSFR